MRNCSGHSGQGVLGRAHLRRLGHDLELVHGFGFVPVAGAQAIGAGVSAADDDDTLAGGQDLVGHIVAGIALILLRQELHGEVNALQLAAGNIQIARSFRTAAQAGWRRTPCANPRPAHSRQRARPSRSARLRPSSVQAPVENVLLHLEVGNAVAHQPAEAVVFFKQGDQVPGAIELLRRGQSRRAPNQPRRRACPCASRAARAESSPPARRARRCFFR